MTQEIGSAKASAAAFALRPGVYRPDWSAVTRPAAREALTGRMTARSGPAEKWAARLDDTEDFVWRSVLELVPGPGRLPRLEEIASATQMPQERLAAVVRQLHRRDLLVFDETRGSLAHAYPFTGKESGHRVQLGAHMLNALCAVDALGIGSMYRRDITIESSCRLCDAQIRIATARNGTALGARSPAGVVVWYDDGYADGCAATSRCPNIAFFCSDAHLGLWLRSQTARRRGRRLSLDEALEIGRALFGPVLTAPPANCGS